MKQPKDKKCRICKEVFKPYSSLSVVCSIPCAVKYNYEKEWKKEKKRIEERVKEYKIAIKGDNVFKYLQDEINKIVRLIDRGHECISSNLPYGKYHINAGHYFGVGSNPALRYNLLNIFAQSKKDNDEFGGNGSCYGLRLKEVFGTEVRDEIEGLVAKYPYLGLKAQDAKEALSICRKIAKELEQNDIILSTEYRILVRKKLNERIGIYK